MGDHVFFKVSSMRGLLWFGKKGKLSSRYVGPFEILERIDTLAYRLMLLPNLSQIHNVCYVSMLRKYESDPTHVLNYEEIEVDNRVSYVEKLVRIDDRMERHGIEGAPWESEESM